MTSPLEALLSFPSSSSSSSSSTTLLLHLKDFLALLGNHEGRQEVIDDVIKKNLILKINSWLSDFLRVPLTSSEPTDLDVTAHVVKLVRNLCAFSQQIQLTAVELGLHLLVAKYLVEVARLLRIQEEPNPDLKSQLSFGVQLLGNMGSGNPKTQAVIWKDLVLSSDLFLRLFAVDDEKLVGNLVLITYLFVCNSEERCLDLAQHPNGRDLSRKLLRIASNKTSNNSQDETFTFIFNIAKKLLEVGHFITLLEGLIDRSQEILVTTEEAVALLKLLDAEVHALFSQQDSQVDDSLPAWLTESLLTPLLELLKRLNMTTLIQRNLLAPGEEQETETTLVLLQLFSELTKAHHLTLSPMLLRLGLAKTIIDLLKESRELKPVTLKSGETLAEDLRSALFGFKAVMVKILGNLAFRFRQAQDEIRELEGLHLIMDSTNIDDSNPYIREWCVLAIRNLCENNLECQEIVRALHIKGPASTPILDELGVQVEITEDGKNVRVKPTSRQ